ncbi:hypothetical protein RJ639_016216, partial [Escallonia herrerae]
MGQLNIHHNSQSFSFIGYVSSTFKKLFKTSEYASKWFSSLSSNNTHSITLLIYREDVETKMRLCKKDECKRVNKQ